MSLHHNPRIVTSGLVLHLDAADVNSYPGSGTTWYDLSGNNNHATAYGHVSLPVYQATKKGRFYFNGTTSKSYFQSSTYSNLTNILNATIIVWAEWVPSTTNRYYAFDSRVGTPSYGAGIGFDKESSTTASPFHFFNDTGGYDEVNSPTTFQQNQVYQLGVSRIGTGTEIQIIDTDSYSYTSATLSANTLGTNAIAQLGPYRVGSYEGAGSGTGEYWWSGYIYSVMMYNRALSASEIEQNYSALRTRFGL